VAAAGPRLPFAWQAQYTEFPGGAAARVAAAGPRLPFAWQAQRTEPSGGAAVRVAAAGAFRLASAVHRASWRSCGAPPLGRGCLLCGRCRTQSLLDELLRAWPPLGRGCLSCGRRSTQSLLQQLRRAWLPLGRGCLSLFRRSIASWRSCGARGRRWAAAAFRLAGAAHRASWSNCGARGRRWAAAAFHTTHHSSTYHITTSHHNP